VNDLPKLILIESVLELVIDVLKFINTEFSFSLEIIQTEVSTSAFFCIWASLKFKYDFTILSVKTFKNYSKLRASPEVYPISAKTLKTISYFSSRPRVLAVMVMSLTSTLLCLGSA
jgi:hypothetical protein